MTKHNTARKTENNRLDSARATESAVFTPRIKTLAKLGKTRQTTPVLNTVKVQSGLAESTDLDIHIFEKTSLNDGVYSAHGVADGTPIKSDIPMADYPDRIRMGKKAGALTLSRSFILDSLAWVAKAMSYEETRYYLCGIAFHQNSIIATDGHRLHMARLAAPFPLPARWQERCMIMPSRAVKYLIDMVKEHKEAESVTVSFYGFGFRVDIGTGAIEAKLVDGTYPDYMRVVGAAENGAVEKTVFVASEFQAILKEYKIIAKAASYKGSLPIRLGNGTASTAQDTIPERSWPVTTKLKNDIGFNIELLCDLCDGDMSYGSASCPVIVRSGNLTGVLMPMRIRGGARYEN